MGREKKLDLGGLKLPRDFVTQTSGVLGIRGSGKTMFARATAEELEKAGLPFVFIDPVGSCWGLRCGADGKPEGGLPIVIFGGEHGDIPLERTGGDLVADTIVDERLSCVLDLSAFPSEAAKRQFLLAFATRLYHRNRDPLLLILDEADDYIPQKPQREATKLLGIFETIVRRGRARGLGIMMLTQRSAVINKNVLTQVETLFTFRTTGPQDMHAIEQWVKYQGCKAEILESLPKLDSGQAWVWSPHWLKDVRKFRGRMSRTFDSGATPKNLRASQTRKAATLADVDLGELRARMAGTIERAQEDDPRVLKRRIAELERKLVNQPKPDPVKVEVRVLDEDAVLELDKFESRLGDAAADAKAALDDFRDWRKSINPATPVDINRLPDIGKRVAYCSDEPIPRTAVRRSPGTVQSVEIPPRARSLSELPRDGFELPKGELTVLGCIAQHGTVSRKALSALTGYKRSTRDQYIQRLAQRGLVDSHGTDVSINADGKQHLPAGWKPLPTGAELREWWLDKLATGEAAVLELVCSRYPGWVDRKQISEATSYKRSTRDQYIQRLAQKLLVTTGSDGSVRAVDTLFEN